MPSINFIANANAVLYCGANPVFIDCELSNLGISANKIEMFIDVFTTQPFQLTSCVGYFSY